MSTPERTGRPVLINPDGLMRIYVQFIRACLDDFLTLPPTDKHYESARACLERCGLIVDGALDTRGYKIHSKRTRKTHSTSPATPGDSER